MKQTSNETHTDTVEMEALQFKGTREATHAGSWYDDDAERLGAELDSYFAQCADESEAGKPARAIVSPHAGYTYCGATMARCYTALAAFFRTLPDDVAVPTVVLMGPSHHVALRSCALTGFKRWATPFGAVDVDTECCAALCRAMPSGSVVQMRARVDEEEHCLEMMLPFLLRAAARAGRRSVRVVPLLVGHVAPATTLQLGRVLADLDEHVALVASSDFCHWGERFGYTVLPEALSKDEAIWQRIERMDREGATRIAAGDLVAFEQYLELTDNTICGRFAISVLLATAQALGGRTGAVLAYAQSSHCTRPRSSSVSYCAIAMYL